MAALASHVSWCELRVALDLSRYGGLRACLALETDGLHGNRAERGLCGGARSVRDPLKCLAGSGFRVVRSAFGVLVLLKAWVVKVLRLEESFLDPMQTSDNNFFFDGAVHFPYFQPVIISVL